MRKTVMQQNIETVMQQLQQGHSIIIRWKWTISKSKDDYGQDICTCYANNLKVGRAIGGGYSLEGTSMEDLIQEISNIQNKDIKVKGGKGLSYIFDTILHQLGYKYKNQYDYANKCYGNYYIIYK